MKLILGIGFAVALGLAIAAVVSSTPGFGDCGAFGYGWEPVWTNGIPGCTSHGVYEAGCCYCADGNDTLAALALGVLPFAGFGLVFALFRGWLESRWVRRQLNVHESDLW